MKRIRRLLLPQEGPSSALTPFVSAGILMIAAAVGLTAWQAKTPAQAPAALVGQAEPATKPAEVSPYTKWLDEDVVYIILPEERAAFLALQTDDERAEFIKQFWQRRDPTPSTPENEFKDEHYRRIAYANLHFPTASGKAGWKTDLGRIYIRFGPPDEIDDHSSGDTRAAVPYIEWTYRFIESRDINGTNVKIEFVDPTGSHDFKMTSDPNPPVAK